MPNYFEYFTEIEQRFQQRRGSILMLSTLDWALIETWREAGVPLAAVLRGIDDAFDRYEQRASRAKASNARLRKVNGLAWAAQAVMQAAQASAEASTGVAAAKPESGLEGEPVAAFLAANAATVEKAGDHADIAGRLFELADAIRADPSPHLEELDRTLTVLEQKMFATVLVNTPEPELVALREEAATEIAPYRSRMQAVQLRQLQEQFLHKRLLQKRGLPRLSLFYMSVQ